VADARNDLARMTLGIVFIALLLGASLWILRPFLPAMIWAAMLSIATWPILQRVESNLWGSRALAATVMTLAILLVFVVPFWLAIATIVRHSGKIIEWSGHLASTGLPPLPHWFGEIPVVGPGITRLWTDLADDSLRELLQKGRPYAGQVTQWFAAAMGGLGTVVVQFLLTVVFAAIMYAKGDHASAEVRRFGRRLAGARGEQAVVLAGQAIRGVALGVVVTAFIQSAIGTVGLVVAGVPFAAVLCALMFMLCIAQLGPGLVLIPAVVWVWIEGSAGPAVILTVTSVLAITVDNFVRPVLIKRGADLPLLLILLGVIGGLMAFGLIGIFLGPTILAVGYTLLRAWIAEAQDAPALTAPTSSSAHGG
jgi:predicted PurR-regulated permease PerM